MAHEKLFIKLLLSSMAIIIFAENEVSANTQPLAWISFADQAVQKYDNIPYLWLGDQSIYLTIDIKPSSEHSIDLLWGSKNDQRGAEIIINDYHQLLKAGNYNGFRWQPVNLHENPSGKQYKIILHAAEPKAAFLAAVRLVKKETPLDQPLPKELSHLIVITETPPHVLYEWLTQLQDENINPWQQASIYGLQANEALRRCRKFIDGWLAHADPKTGLIPRNLNESRYFWNGRDAAADNYSFMVLTSALTDTDLYNGRMADMLRTETELTCRIDALPGDYDFNKQDFRFDKPQINRLIFDGSEYVKDGLMPITEWLGPTAWSQRMISIVDSIIRNSPFKTARGNIPSDNVEVNGEMMQVLSRLRFMTSNDKYLDMACRIADYYLLDGHHPTRNSEQLGLRDHNCELISGLTEVYAACHVLRKEKADAYHEPVHAMLDDILKYGVNDHGLMYQTINPRTGQILNGTIHDNWGYNYNGFYTVYLLDGIQRYRKATRRALSSLKPHYWKFAWQGWGSDGIADSVEGAINLYNREQDIQGVSEWIDANMNRMLLIQKPDGIIEGWHGDGNYARTAIMWVLMKQQGITVQPWRQDVKLGAVRDGNKIKFVITADLFWDGKLFFDKQRHKMIMKLPVDYPRINQFPEWFTVDPKQEYTINEEDGESKRFSGVKMIDGLPIKLDKVLTKRFIVNIP